MTNSSGCGVLILAAGLGKRMHSPLPKVLHEIGGKPLIFRILDRVRATLPGASVAIVVGHGREKVEEAVRKNPDYSALNLTFVHQPEQKGTGHAARCAMESDWGKEAVKRKLPVLVLPGDLPLIPDALVSEMTQPLVRSAAFRLLTCVLPDPTGYGRIVRRGKAGPVRRIVEERDAKPAEKQISEVAASIYTFNAAFLLAGLHKVSNKNSQGEYYLTDLVAQASGAKKTIDVLRWENPEDLRGVNDPWELAQASEILNQRCLKKWAQAGVTIVSPATTRIDDMVILEEGAVLHPGVILTGSTRIGKGAVIGPNAVLRNTRVDESANVKVGTVSDSSAIGASAQVGPYAHLRPESLVGRGAKIGNFVELKKTRVGEGTSIAHLSYLGDAEVGERVNIGCGFVTCNFDGRLINGERKHRTIIEDDVFLGSDCQAVAPVTIGKGSYIASGSTITQDVQPGSLAIARSRQVNKPGYAKKFRPERE